MNDAIKSLEAEGNKDAAAKKRQELAQFIKQEKEDEDEMIKDLQELSGGRFTERNPSDFLQNEHREIQVLKLQRDLLIEAAKAQRP